MKTVLVTGANGFVGSHLVKNLIEDGIEVVAVGHNANFSNLPKSELIRAIDCDLASINKLPDILGCDIDVFFHLAWAGSAGDLRKDYSLQLDNVAYTCDAVRAAKLLGCSRFVGVGSIMERESLLACTQFGGRPGAAYVYGAGKLAAHCMARAVAVEQGIDFLWGRITNAYGVGEVSPRLVNSTLRKCISGEKLQFTEGSQLYDFIYIDDAARAIRLIGECGLPFGDYVIGSSHARPLREFLMELIASVSPDADYSFGTVPFTGIALTEADYDASPLERDTGFRAQVTFEDGCKRTFNWLRDEAL